MNRVCYSIWMNKNHIHQSLPANPKTEKLAIVMFNQLGSNTHGDHGRDGNRLADALNVPVFTVNRPGTDTFDYFSGAGKRIQRNVLAEHEAVLKATEVELGRLGIQSVVLTGRSAGGMSALLGAQTEVLPVTGVYAAEPVGWVDASKAEVAQQNRAYLQHQKEVIQSDDDKLVRPEPSDTEGLDKIRRLISIPFLAAKDMARYKEVFGSTVSRDALEFIIKRGGIDVSIEFAEHSMVIDDKILEDIIVYFERVVAPTGLSLGHVATPSTLHASLKSGAELNIKKIPNTVHASFDNRGFFAQRVEPTVARALLSAN